MNALAQFTLVISLDADSIALRNRYVQLPQSITFCDARFSYDHAVLRNS